MTLSKTIKDRFRQFLPVVIDIETAGINPQTDAVLEICAVTLTLNEKGRWRPHQVLHEHVAPFDGSNLCPKSLQFNGIDPFHPFRYAKQEKAALEALFAPIKAQIKQHKCQRAVLVGHNAWFDLLFLKAAIERSQLTSPFHAFTTFDTATLAALAYGQTVLVKACQAANIPFDTKEAHSAIYDAKKTAELFCTIVNTWDKRS